MEDIATVSGQQRQKSWAGGGQKSGMERQQSLFDMQCIEIRSRGERANRDEWRRPGEGLTAFTKVLLDKLQMD